MQSETGFPSSHQLKSYVASKSRLKLAARAVLSADAGLLVNNNNNKGNRHTMHEMFFMCFYFWVVLLCLVFVQKTLKAFFPVLFFSPSSDTLHHWG